MKKYAKVTFKDDRVWVEEMDGDRVTKVGPLDSFDSLNESSCDVFIVRGKREDMIINTSCYPTIVTTSNGRRASTKEVEEDPASLIQKFFEEGR